MQIRYYDLETGRFLNADVIAILDEAKEFINGLNLFAYCFNNPVMFSDRIGCSPFWDKIWNVVKWIGVGVLAVGAIVATVAGVVMTGGAAAVLLGAGIGILTGMGGSLYSQVQTGGWGNVDPGKLLVSGAIGGTIGAIAGAASFGLGQIGQFAGNYFGLCLSQAKIGGLLVNKVFSTKLLFAAGGVIGKVAGGLIGGTVANYFANQAFGNQIDFDQTMREGFYGELPSWLIDFFKWIRR